MSMCSRILKHGNLVGPSIFNLAQNRSVDITSGVLLHHRYDARHLHAGLGLGQSQFLFFFM